MEGVDGVVCFYLALYGADLDLELVGQIVYGVAEDLDVDGVGDIVGVALFELVVGCGLAFDVASSFLGVCGPVAFGFFSYVLDCLIAIGDDGSWGGGLAGIVFAEENGYA